MVIRLLLIGLLLAAPATTALAEGLYVGVSGGETLVHKSDINSTSKTQFSSTDFAGDVTYEAGYAVNAAVGYNFDGLRLEAEFGYKDADTGKVSYSGPGASYLLKYSTPPVVDSNLTVRSYMVNAYYDFTNVPAIITPFIGGGIGFADIKLDNNSVSFYQNLSGKGFGYQLTAGVTGKVSKHVNLDLYYRFMGTTFDLEYNKGDSSLFRDSSTISPHHSSNILAGLRYTF